MTRATYRVLCLGGTTESWPGDKRKHVTGLLSHVTQQLHPGQFEPVWAGYAASYLYGQSFVDSINTGVQALIDELAKDDRPAILCGYSQGSSAITELLRDIACGAYPDLKPLILAAYLFANPERPDGPSIGNAPHYGVALDPHETSVVDYGIPVVEVAHPDDCISGAHPDSLVRLFVERTKFATFGDPIAFGNNLLAKIRNHNWRQDVTRLRQIPGAYANFHRSATEALGFIAGKHTVSYILENVPGRGVSYVDWVAYLIEDRYGDDVVTTVGETAA
ncbi:MAG: PE-PPE domain-containing protein [Comamonadaceae bacterium]|nr:MAG: PE-PPE domain-containing protein [Comamonadaceae bacterium]